MSDLLADCAELSLQVDTGIALHQQLVKLVSRSLGAEGACMLTLTEGRAVDLVNNLDDTASFAAAMAIHADELTPTELAIQMSAATVSTADIFSPRRRDQLNLFRSYLPRLGMSAGVSRLWFDRNHFHFIAVTCSRQADFGRFRNRVAPALDRVFPLLAVAERLVRAPSTASDAAGSVSPELAREFKLTPAEGDTLALVLRGLTNREIAHVHGLSVNTVRNRLSVCFQKLGATRRTEALFILGEARRKQAVSSEPPLAQLQRWLASARSARKA